MPGLKKRVCGPNQRLSNTTKKEGRDREGGNTTQRYGAKDDDLKEDEEKKLKRGLEKMPPW